MFKHLEYITIRSRFLVPIHYVLINVKYLLENAKSNRSEQVTIAKIIVNCQYLTANH